MANKKRAGGLRGVDALFATGEEDSQADKIVTKKSSPKKAQPTPKSRPKAKRAANPKGEKTAGPKKRARFTIELSLETLELIDQLKTQYRRENNKHWPKWKMFDKAIQEMAQRRLK